MTANLEEKTKLGILLHLSFLMTKINSTKILTPPWWYNSHLYIWHVFHCDVFSVWKYMKLIYFLSVLKLTVRSNLLLNQLIVLSNKLWFIYKFNFMRKVSWYYFVSVLVYVYQNQSDRSNIFSNLLRVTCLKLNLSCRPLKGKRRKIR